MEKPFPAYDGDEPYVFVCYAHVDAELVYPEMRWLRESGVNLWYDEGISPGELFTDELAAKINDCHTFLYFVSPRSVASRNCLNEIQFATARDKRLVAAYVEPTQLPGGLELSIGLAQAVMKHDMPAADFQRKMSAALGIPVERPASESQTASTGKAHRPWRRYVPIGLAAAILAGIGWWYWDLPMDADVSKTAPDDASIAVLPFVNLSPDPEQEYFVDGLSEELMSQLAKIPDLHVAGRTSSFAFKARSTGFDVIGATLGVEHVLEGSVRRAGDDLRITAQLISIADGFELWSGTYDRKLDDVFAIQREIATAVARALSLELGVDPRDFSYGGTQNATAYAHYLRGRTIIFQQSAATLERGNSELEQAVDIDPDFARAWVELSASYGMRARDPAHTEEALADMARAAARAVALAPGLWETQAAQGWVLLSYHDFVAADRAFERALDLPKLGEGSPLNSIAAYLAQVGRLTEALAEHRLSQRIDPLYLIEPWLLYYLGRREDALAEWERNKELQPGRPDGITRLSLAMEQSDPAAMNARLAGTPLAGLWGSPDEFLAVLRPGRDSEMPTFRRGIRAILAMYAAHHGDTDLALQFLRAEYLVDGFGSYFMIWSPALREVRTTPGFKSFVRDLGLLELWRTTGKWGDFCRPIGDDDFECT